MGTQMKKIISPIISIFLIISMLLCTVIVVKIVTKKDRSFFGYRVFYLVSGSMEPNIKKNSIVIVHKQDSYEVGDVITFESRDPGIYGSANTHRIIGVEGNKYITKGDANNTQDLTNVGKENIFGKVIWDSIRLPLLGGFLRVLSKPIGFTFIVLCPLIIDLILLIKDFHLENKKNKKEVKEYKLDSCESNKV